MKRYLALTMLLLPGLWAVAEEPAATKAAPLKAEEAADGFVSLFNGENLDGWWIRGAKKESFAVEDGKLVVVDDDKGDGDWIFTNEEYANFVLRYEYRIPHIEGDSIGNSGVGIRATRRGNPAFTGMEIQVIKPGWENDWQSACALYSTVPPKVFVDRPVGEWNEVEVLCDGPRVRTIFNGTELYDIKMTDYTPEKTAGSEWQKPLTDRVMKGHIALQDHGDTVEFRNIRIKTLPDSKE